MNLNIIFLQETHLQDNTLKSQVNYWKGKIVFTHGNTKGVCILIQNLEYTLLDKTIDSNGRYTVLRISIENSVYVICNIYGHNQDKVEYFEEILSIVNSLDKEHIIIAGGFNMIMDRNLDCIDRQKNSDRLFNYFANWCEQNSAVDPFRFNCPEDRKYTWFRHNPSLIASRLDII